jgi:hypothetical protein
VKAADTDTAVLPVTVAGTASAVTQPELMPLSVQRTNETVASAKFASTVPFRVADVLVIALAADVVTVGADGFNVLKVATVPFVVPSEFTATTLNQYEVFLVSPATPSVTGIPLEPVTVAGTASTVTQPELMPLSVQRTNDTVVSARFAFTVPFSVADVLVIALAADVVTVGADGFNVLKDVGGLAAVTEPAVTWK